MGKENGGAVLGARFWASHSSSPEGTKNPESVVLVPGKAHKTWKKPGQSKNWDLGFV